MADNNGRKVRTFIIDPDTRPIARIMTFTVKRVKYDRNYASGDSIIEFLSNFTTSQRSDGNVAAIVDMRIIPVDTVPSGVFSVKVAADEDVHQRFTDAIAEEIGIDYAYPARIPDGEDLGEKLYRFVFTRSPDIGTSGKAWIVHGRYTNPQGYKDLGTYNHRLHIAVANAMVVSAKNRERLMRGAAALVGDQYEANLMTGGAFTFLALAIDRIIDKYSKRHKVEAETRFKRDDLLAMKLPPDLVMLACSRSVTRHRSSRFEVGDSGIVPNVRFNILVNITAGEWRRDLQRNPLSAKASNPINYGILLAFLKTRLYPQVRDHVKEALSLFPEEIKEYMNAKVRRRRRPSPKKPDLVSTATLWRLVRCPGGVSWCGDWPHGVNPGR